MILLENTYDSYGNINVNINNKYYFTNIPLYPEIYNGYNTYNITNNITSHKVDIFNSLAFINWLIILTSSSYDFIEVFKCSLSLWISFNCSLKI